ncbi:MAG: sugar ABC transporter substrate-binding protein [Symploca sp. SIO3E6]|nr:sugar ABC transporter substrate-binding protein [Caldora sp. SIO3E6]
MLEDNDKIQIVWGGSNLATELAIQAVKELNLQEKVAIFGILDLSRDTAEMLIDDESPLQLIIDQAGVEIGYQAVKTAVDVLRGERSGEEYCKKEIQHNPLTQDDEKKVYNLLNGVDTNDESSDSETSCPETPKL